MTTKQIYTTPDSEWVILHSRPMMTTASFNDLYSENIGDDGEEEIGWTRD